jgi:hypothetical protein
MSWKTLRAKRILSRGNLTGGGRCNHRLIILVIAIVAGSRYQPIEVRGLIGIDHPTSAHRVEVSQEFSLKNAGPFGVIIEDMKGGLISASSKGPSVATAFLCPYSSRFGFDCLQNDGTGLMTGVKFHPFGLATDDVRPILWLYQYPCNFHAHSSIQ